MYMSSSSDEIDENKCEVCQQSAKHKCGKCYNVYYCGKEHQKNDWRKHKKICRPLQINLNEEFGRFIIATKPIKKGEKILQESPLIWGPSQYTVAVCLGCGKAINEKNSKSCRKCGWPMCSDLCEKTPAHIPECLYTAQRGEKVSVKNFGIPHPIYQCIIILRCLYQKQFLPKVWKKLDSLESHCQERKSTPKYNQEKISIVQFIRKFFKLQFFNEDEIMRICGIVMINSHEVPLSEPPYLAIYETTSMFQHDCKANCTKSFANNGDILITAAQNIMEKNNLSICYTDALWGTPNRRIHLFESKFFWCLCQRCSDPTEFNTNFNSIKCQNELCNDGYLLPNSFCLNDATSKPINWGCNKCNKFVSNYFVLDILERIGRDLSELNKEAAEECKNFLITYENYLHPNHYYFIDVKYQLCQLLGQEFKAGIAELPDEDLELKIILCRNLVDLLKTICPAEVRNLGLILFELHAAIAEQGRRKSNLLENPDILKIALIESRLKLLESLELLKNEPSVLPEGKVYQQGKLNLRNIDRLLHS